MTDHELAVAFDGVVKRFAVQDHKFTRRMALNLADMSGCEVRTLILRLERMTLLKNGSWEWFCQNGGFTKSHYEDVYKTETSHD